MTHGARKDGRHTKHTKGGGQQGGPERERDRPAQWTGLEALCVCRVGGAGVGGGETWTKDRL